MDKMKKFVFQLDTPYSTVSWPPINTEDQATMLELLCTLLSPIGHYRSKYIHPSKGKREKKRKRREESTSESQLASPPAPKIASCVDVGLASITRCLKEAATKAGGLTAGTYLKADATDKELATPCYSAIFVARSGQPNILNSHLPQMVALASEASPLRTPIRLVGLSKACQDRLSESLGIPRVSCIGIRRDAPNSRALVNFACQHVPVIEVTWLKEARKADYKETKINTIQTVVGRRSRAKQQMVKS
ncbi:hypothetical protein BJ170DRAFT_622241 [Xylariales sp. AK1849]|nr:hypothetical protein BJ170DRAFT_622241 [Xylariales sp. AK1849]